MASSAAVNKVTLPENRNRDGKIGFYLMTPRFWERNVGVSGFPKFEDRSVIYSPDNV